MYININVHAGKDSRRIQANLRSVVDAAEIGDFEIEEFLRKIEVLKDDETVRFLHVGRKLRQIVIGSHSDR